MTQSHVTHSATCNIVWIRQDSHTRCPVGVPGIHETPKNMQDAKLSLVKLGLPITSTDPLKIQSVIHT